MSRQIKASLVRARRASLSSETLQTRCVPSNGNAALPETLTSYQPELCGGWFCLALPAFPSVGVAEGSREAKTICILQPLHFCIASK